MCIYKLRAVHVGGGHRSGAVSDEVEKRQQIQHVM